MDDGEGPLAAVVAAVDLHEVVHVATDVDVDGKPRSDREREVPSELEVIEFGDRPVRSLAPHRVSVLIEDGESACHLGTHQMESVRVPIIPRKEFSSCGGVVRLVGLREAVAGEGLGSSVAAGEGGECEQGGDDEHDLAMHGVLLAGSLCELGFLPTRFPIGLRRHVGQTHLL